MIAGGHRRDRAGRRRFVIPGRTGNHLITVASPQPGHPGRRGGGAGFLAGFTDRGERSVPGQRPRYRGRMAASRTTTVTVPIVIERDEDGVWCAHAQLRPGVGAHGEGATEQEALDDLREALVGLIEEFGVPRELSVTVAA